jgi:alkylation response protein AidB-like acyl-CoA dehydrogenase
VNLEEFQDGLDSWLDEHAEALAPPSTHELSSQISHLSRVKALTYDAGWMRWGWPERVGGLGGSPLHRAYLGEALTSRDLVEPGIYSMTEVLAPTMIDYASPDLAAEMVPRLLRGDEIWCQGFSEPDTGSNLGALRCRAERRQDGWRITGQKLWTSLAQYAHRCVLLARTGSRDAAHRGISAFFLDMDSPGITVVPIETIHGVPEFCEVFLDDVPVPSERMLGHEGQGWAVAMSLLPYERSTALWHRAAFLRRRLQRLVETAPPDAIDPARLGDVTQMLYAFRARSRATLRRLDQGETLGPETSVDKILLATVEQSLFDLVLDALSPGMVMNEGGEWDRWRSEYLYSRAATIYGGTAEIQRNIVARRLLDLGDDR